MFPKRGRCGIYVLHFANGELYAGQAVDVNRRYGQHRKTYNDIARLSFRLVLPDKLNEQEQKTIQGLENAGFRLRNKTYTSVTYSPSPFDEIMPPDEQIRWSDDLDYIDLSGERVDEPNIRRKYARNYRQLLNMPLSEDIISVLHEYRELAFQFHVKARCTIGVVPVFLVEITELT